MGKDSFLELMARGLGGRGFQRVWAAGVVTAGARERDPWEGDEGAVGRARKESRELGSGGKKKMGRVFQGEGTACARARDGAIPGYHSYSVWPKDRVATGGGGRVPPQGLERRGQPAGGAGALRAPPRLLRSSGRVRGGGTARGHPFKSASGRLPSLRGAGRCADIKARAPSLIPRRKGRASR